MEKENKLGTMPISKLIINMSLPIIISMLVQALYNIVDSVFVSRVCEQALTAVSLAFPAEQLPLFSVFTIDFWILSMHCLAKTVPHEKTRCAIWQSSAQAGASA